jgi:hypothetical protein
MEVTLPPELKEQVRQELASGRHRSLDELLERAFWTRGSGASSGSTLFGESAAPSIKLDYMNKR